jgi:acyl dehydratase
LAHRRSARIDSSPTRPTTTSGSTSTSRARQVGPFASTIAHGYLTLSLVNALLPQLFRVPNAMLAINRGCHKVRFPAPVPSGSRIRALGDLLAVDEVSGGVDVVCA